MNRDIQWFSWFCIENGLFDRRTTQGLRDAVSEEMDLVEFAELILELGITRDFDQVQELLDQYVDDPRVRLSEDPPYDPFALPPKGLSLSLRRKAAHAETPPDDPAPESSQEESAKRPDSTGDGDPGASGPVRKLKLSQGSHQDPSTPPGTDEDPVARIAASLARSKATGEPPPGASRTPPAPPQKTPAPVSPGQDTVAAIAARLLQQGAASTPPSTPAADTSDPPPPFPSPVPDTPPADQPPRKSALSEASRPVDSIPALDLPEETTEADQAESPAGDDFGTFSRAPAPARSYSEAEVVPSTEQAPPPGQTGSGSSSRGPIAEAVAKVGSAKPGWPDFSKLNNASDETIELAMKSLLMACTQTGASDLHLSADARPFLRKTGRLSFLSDHPLGRRVASRLNLVLLSPVQRALFEEDKDFDFALSLDPGYRFRVNLMVHKDGLAGTYRTVSSEPKSLDELGFPNAGDIKKLLAYHNGLILVTGPLGAGKSTTLAAMVRHLNETRNDHIITVEEPIEMLLHSGSCQITQRSVGAHTRNFRTALKGALRQDPDIIVIGEMRDLETIEMAITASETGHLVIGTMHTNDAANTLNRILDVFPPAQQPQIRAMVAESLRGIICQRLLPDKFGGVVLAVEFLVRNSAISANIREGKTQGLSNIMETGKREGMRLMDASVMELWRRGAISDETALATVRNRMLHREILGPAQTGTHPDSSETAGARKRGLFG